MLRVRLLLLPACMQVETASVEKARAEIATARQRFRDAQAAFWNCRGRVASQHVFQSIPRRNPLYLRFFTSPRASLPIFIFCDERNVSCLL